MIQTLQGRRQSKPLPHTSACSACPGVQVVWHCLLRDYDGGRCAVRQVAKRAGQAGGACQGAAILPDAFVCACLGACVCTHCCLYRLSHHYHHHPLALQVTEGYRLPCPAECPQEFHDVMMKTWQQDPHLRPSCTEIMLVRHATHREERGRERSREREREEERERLREVERKRENVCMYVCAYMRVSVYKRPSPSLRTQAPTSPVLSSPLLSSPVLLCRSS